ncbi:MAG: ATPase [Spirochaetaceae bacterium]|nr:ATPase [Spirochaetaceae bacterium]
MIVPMKKVSFVVTNDAKKEALKELRKIGVVHLEQIYGSSEKLSQLKDTYNKLEEVLMFLSDIKYDKKTIEQKKLSSSNVVEKVNQIIELNETKKNYIEELSSASRELERLAAWGGFNPDDFSYLAEKGINLLPFECSTDAYKKIPEDVNCVYVNSDKTQVRFLVISEDGSKPESLTSEYLLVSNPEMSTADLSESCVKYRKEISSIDKELQKNVCYIQSIKDTMKVYAKDIEFENAYSGMATDAEEGTEANLAWLTGYVPADELSIVQKTAKENHWACLADDPSEEDEVPTKLKNNKFVSLIYPVSDFLGTVPGYREYDISSWFLLFFCVFFGMIFGDGGYGLLLVGTALGMFLSNLVKRKSVPAPLYLLLLLGLSTTMWGALTCNWFGLKPELLPETLKPILFSLDWNYISNASSLPTNLVTENLQIFCFSLALIHLSIAHLMAIAKNIKSPKFLGDLGSLLLLWGIFYLVLNMVVNGVRFPFNLDIADVPLALGANAEFAKTGISVATVMFPLIGIGFVLNFVFANYNGSVIESVKESCVNIISVLLGVVNVFSDIVSYIRLWAVGLAGAAIAQTVNEMAGPTLGGFLIFAGIILLVFGHGLNMVLNVLSVIVHGVRLNTLEFSSHLGMSWSGFSYKPFADK